MSEVLHPEYKMTLSNTQQDAIYLDSDVWKNTLIECRSTVFVGVINPCFWQLRATLPSEVTFDHGVITIKNNIDFDEFDVWAEYNNPGALVVIREISFSRGNLTLLIPDGINIHYTRNSDTNTFYPSISGIPSEYSTILYDYDKITINIRTAGSGSTKEISDFSKITYVVGSDNSRGYLWFNEYPSGLVYKIGVHNINGTVSLSSAKINFSTNEIIRNTSNIEVTSVKLYSPVQKTYAFLYEYDNVFQINYNDWTEGSTAFYEIQPDFCFANNKYYLFTLDASHPVNAKILLFIDPNLWVYKDGSLQKNIALYPMYKYNNKYYLNREEEHPIGNYLTSFGSAYQYYSRNELKEVYVMRSSERCRNSAATNRKEKNNAQWNIPSGKIRPRFGVIENKAIDYDNSFAATKDRYKEANVNIVIPDSSYFLMYSNYPECAPFGNLDDTKCFCIDEYHSYIGGKIYRHSKTFKIIKMERFCTASVQEAYDNAPTYIPEGYFGEKTSWVAPFMILGTGELEDGIANAESTRYLHYNRFECVYMIRNAVSTSDKGIQMETSIKQDPSRSETGNPNPAIFYFKLRSSDYDFDFKQLTERGWEEPSVTINQNAVLSENTLHYVYYCNIHLYYWSESFKNVILLHDNYDNTSSENDNHPGQFQFDFDITCPCLSLSKFVNSGFSETKTYSWINKSNNPINFENDYIKIDANSSHIYFWLQPKWKCNKKGILPSRSTPANILRTTAYFWHYPNWILARPTDVHENVARDGYTFTAASYKNVGFTGFNATFNTECENAICIFGHHYNIIE